MSTRATYVFKPGEKDYTRNVTWVYIHYDGYPEGAAVYFYNAIMSDNQRGNMATVFIKSNPLAEITKGHHGDTEFHYDIMGKGLTADLICRGRKWTMEGHEEWDLVFAGTMREFIEKYAVDFDEYYPFKFVRHGYMASWLNMPMARNRINSLTDKLSDWARDGRILPGNVNWDDSQKEIFELLKEFPELADEISEKLFAINALVIAGLEN